jgi:hypothetical protein
MNVNVNGHTLRTGLPDNVISVTTTPYNAGTDLGYVVLLVDCTSGNRTINLPTAANNTDCFVIKKIDSTANTVIIDPSGTETVDGSTTASIGVQYVSLTLVSDGTNWHII